MTTTARQPVVRRIATLVVLSIAAFHMIGTFFWVAPSNPARDEVGTPFMAHMRPMFGQSWRIFAPNPQVVDLRVWVRVAEPGPDGEEIATEWVNLSAIFNEQVHHSVLPTRTWRIPVSLNRYYTTAHDKLTDAQRQVVHADHTGPDGRDHLRAALFAAGASATTVEDYLRAEDALYEFGTHAALALWPDADVSSVQMSTSTQGLVPFSERDLPGVERPAETFQRVGWRPPLKGAPDARDGFVDVFGRFVP